MPPRFSRRDFLELMRGIAGRHALELSALSNNWILQFADVTSGKTCSVFGYTFDINPAAAVEICKEKAATSLVLQTHGVPNISHSVFLSPGNTFTAPYVPASGMWAEVQALIRELGFPVVVKPLKGTGGINVIKATCWRDLEAAVQHIYGQEYGLAVSPYKRIIDEYRCFYLDGRVELVYRKVRSHVQGDGELSVAALFGQLIAAAPPQDVPALAQAAASIAPEDLTRVPAKGECVPLQWKHNLGQGARADLGIPAETAARLAPLAAKAAKAVGVRFCSVDVVDVENEGLMIMEVNSGVMMDSLITQMGDEGLQLATRLYEAAILRALGRAAA